jgi:hypothetical protein
MEWMYAQGLCENPDDYILRNLLMPKEKGPEGYYCRGSVRVVGEKRPYAGKAMHLHQVQ